MVGKRALIIGAGFSGLVVGYELSKAGFDVEIFEAQSGPGGLARTTRFSEYYLDLGPHLFHTSNPDIAGYWESLFPGEFRFPALYGGNFVDGMVFDYPLTRKSVDQFDASVKAQILAEWDQVSAESASSATNYKDYIVSIAGPTLQNMFYEEYPKKLWGIPTESLSANWAPQRIEIREERRPFHGSQWCGVAIKGCGHIADLLAAKIVENGGRITYDTELTSVSVDGNRISKLTFGKDEVWVDVGDVVVSTISINRLAFHLGVDTDLSFRHIKLVSFVIEGADPLPLDYDWLYFQDPKMIFHRVGSQTRFSAAGIRRGYSILTAEVAYSPGDAVDEMSDDELVSRCALDLEVVGLGPQGLTVQTHVVDAGPVYPAYKVGFEGELRRIEGQFASFINLYNTGSLANFAYSDLQIIFAKSLDLASRISRPEYAYNNVRKSSRRLNTFQPELSIRGVPIGPSRPPFLIAEIGLNHNGSLTQALSLIDQAVEAGFPAVKFQTYQQGRASSQVEDARYKEDLLDLEESLDEMFDRLVTPPEFLADALDYANQRGLIGFSTPFDSDSVLLLESLDVPMYKVSSMDLVNLPLVKEIAETGKPMILSTGMSSMVEIEEALEVVRAVGNMEVVLLHCLSSYPSPSGELNLMAIKKMADYFALPVGFSDHSVSNELIPAAVALGARVIEKHVTIDKGMKGPDHNFSLDLDGMKDLSKISRSTFFALGDGVKRVMPSEMETLRSLRRSIFAAWDIPEGTPLDTAMLTVKSPGTGIMPKYIPLITGRVTKKFIARDFPVTWDDV